MKSEFSYCKNNIEIWEVIEKYNKEFQRNRKQALHKKVKRIGVTQLSKEKAKT